MNRLTMVFFVSAALVLAALCTAGTSRAQSTTLSEEHISKIRQNCVTAQTTLSQLHASDGVLRVNLGPMYENMSTKLMAPLNSRIALNRYQGLKLAATTLEYDRHFGVFRSSYIQYEKSMSNTLNINCAENPVAFYESVQATKEKRLKLHEDTKTLVTLLAAYKTEFEDFSRRFEEGTL